MAFLDELEAWKTERLAPILGAGRMSVVDGRGVPPGGSAAEGRRGLIDSGPGDARQLLQIALANEINVSELAATWMPSTRELDVKIAFARQAGDEANHFQLVADRLTALGFDVAGFAQTDNPMFQYLRGLTTTVERVAAGLFTLESIAYGVNENFMAFCDARGDTETVRIYREYIQPDERAHQQLGHRLLASHATTPELQQRVRDTVGKLLEIAGATRATAAARLGTAAFPGC
jgi:uncharacterized ferritin-like protein (DUF455 family)